MSVRRVKAHFKKVDPVIFAVMQKMDLKPLSPKAKSPAVYFRKLCDDIVSQQLAGKAAEAIFGRLVKLMTTDSFSPQQVLAVKDRELRDVGLSWAKVSYLKDLAGKVTKKEIKLNRLPELSNQEVIAELVKVKGIGPWTAEMFLIFTLGREDVFSHGDLGLRNALQKLYRLRKSPTVSRAEKIVKPWSPYRSYGSLALWHSLDNR